MQVSGVAPLMVVRDIARSVEFHRRCGFRPLVAWSTYAKACAELVAAGVKMLTEPVEPEWGGEVRAFLRDPDGHLVEINEALPR